MKKQNWTSQTNQFPDNEILILQEEDADNLVEILSKSIPIVALRGLAEVLLNGDEEKFKRMVIYKEFNALWRKCDRYILFDRNDRKYVKMIEKKILSI